MLFFGIMFVLVECKCCFLPIFGRFCACTKWIIPYATFFVEIISWSDIKVFVASHQGSILSKMYMYMSLSTQMKNCPTTSTEVFSHTRKINGNQMFCYL